MVDSFMEYSECQLRKRTVFTGSLILLACCSRIIFFSFYSFILIYIVYNLFCFNLFFFNFGLGWIYRFISWLLFYHRGFIGAIDLDGVIEGLSINDIAKNASTSSSVTATTQPTTLKREGNSGIWDKSKQSRRATSLLNIFLPNSYGMYS